MSTPARDAAVDDAVDAAFAADGALARALPGYAPRAEQRAMAAAVLAAVRDRAVLACEAGTGTGKTLAYLVPALLAGGRVLVSTGTRNLQEQLREKDLPLALAATARTARAAVLKGRANYLCLHRLDLALAEGRFADDSVPADLERIREWAARTREGDVAEVDAVPEDASAWRHATSTAESCLGHACPRVDECHVLRARRRAMDADVVIVNHHLFLADMALKDDGFGELLPDVDTVILDEAHQLPDTATRFFGTSLTSGQIRDLVRDALAAARAEAGDVPDLPPLLDAVRAATAALHESIARAAPPAPARLRWRTVAAPVAEPAAGLRAALARLRDGLSALAERGPSLAACAARARDALARLDRLAGDEEGEAGDEDGVPANVRWIELRERAFAWHASPIDVGARFAERVGDAPRAWILTSATLAVGGRLEHFLARLGIEDARACVWESPFDFARNTLCWLPREMPDPAAAHYADAVAEVARRAVAASRGRAFLLYTSHGALARAAARLRGTLEHPMLVQGEAPRGELLRRFVELPGAVLLGTYGFWEGVDVRGEALSLVLIDKLPFAPPDDPLVQARSEAARARGGNPFAEVALPAAVLALKQGVGRLVRDAADRGVVVLCDPRLRSRGYGRTFLASLPPMPTTEEPGDVERFFAEPARADAP